MRNYWTFLVLLGALFFPAIAGARDEVELLGVHRIWDQGPHSAFTSLVRFHDRFVCAFREAPAHVGPAIEGKMRVISSTDADHWGSLAQLEDNRGDIRDAKLAVMPDGRLMLLTATRIRGTPARHQSAAWFTSDLKSWEGPVDVGESNIWIWGIRWHKGVGYSIGYSTTADHFDRLYKTTDGRHFEKLVDRLAIPAKFPNENAIVFDEQDVAHVLVRSDPDNACVGTAAAPYTKWTWKQTNARVGGPALMQTLSGRLLGGGRLHDGKIRTSLFWVNPENATLTECLTLPSGGDTSYPGFVLFDGVLYVSYYSSHEKNTAIYLARCRLPSEGVNARMPEQILHDALQKRGELPSIHAAEALIALGQSDRVRAEFEAQAQESRQPYRILVWRVLARCAEGGNRQKLFVEKIRSALLDPSSLDRTHSMESLAKLGANITDAERPFIEQTSAEPGPDAPFAAWRLALAGSQSAPDRLIGILSSADPVTRARAANALTHLKIQTPQARQALEAALTHETSSSPARPMILVALGGQRVRPLLDDPSAAARYQAALYLSRDGQQEDLKSLAPLLHDTDLDVRVAAAFATLRIEKRAQSH